MFAYCRLVYMKPLFTPLKLSLQRSSRAHLSKSSFHPILSKLSSKEDEPRLSHFISTILNLPNKHHSPSMSIFIRYFERFFLDYSLFGAQTLKTLIQISSYLIYSTRTFPKGWLKKPFGFGSLIKVERTSLKSFKFSPQNTSLLPEHYFLKLLESRWCSNNAQISTLLSNLTSFQNRFLFQVI